MTLTWTDFLGEEKKKPYFKTIMDFLKQESSDGKIIYPSKKSIFSALQLTPFEQVKIVILGQDPYHGPNQAHGLCFSVQPGVPPPPSLLNIYKELHADIGCPLPTHGHLEQWAHEGVLLLNTTLTVEAHKPASHAKIGWQTFTDMIISALNYHQKGIVYLLWGAHAQSKEALIDTSKHRILKAPHPSPLSAHRGFLGCRHFSKANSLLVSMGQTPVNWCL